MRSGLAQIVVFATAGLLAGQVSIHAQQADVTVIPEVQDQSYCPRSSPSRAAQSSGTEVSIDNVTFSGFLQMPISDQDEIATAIRQETHGDALDGVIQEALERVRAGWQNRGYFKVTVSGDTRTLTENAADVHITLFVHVDEGLRYTLGAITFKHNKAISNVEALRALFPINDGEIFSREKIAMGLEVLRKAYGQLGYINFTSVPDTTFDDQKKLIFLEIDVDEGKQFYVSSIDIVGADAEVLNDLALTPGQAYDVRLIELFLRKHLPGADVNDPNIQHRQLDERNGTVALTFDFRSCPD
jgi:outer membrane protein assembly factor BamA